MTRTLIRYSQGAAKYFVEVLGNKVELEMMLIPDGSFIMGAPETEEGSSKSERPQHQVKVSTFFMSKYPVTQAQWQAVASLPQVNHELNLNPSEFKGDNLPVETVSWYDTIEFCQRLSEYTKRPYRLPSEAEWEYACRAGTTTPFHFGETITTDLANYRGTDNKESKLSGSYGRGSNGIYRESTTPVDSFDVANAFGLCDMHGNLWEWCLDDWHNNYEGAPTDGSAWLDSDDDNLYLKKGYAVLRGGSWYEFPGYCRCASRNNSMGVGRRFILNIIGFRVVCAFGRILK